MRDQRHILLPNVHNFRDIGGYPAADGSLTRWNRLYRTDSLAELTKDGWKGLKELGVCCIIDLRSAKERELMPVEPQYTLNYQAFSLMGDSEFGPAPTPVLEDEKDAKSAEGMNPEDNPGSGKGAAKDAEEEFLKSMRLNYPATLFTNIGCAVNILDTILEVLEAGKGSIAYMCSAGKDRTGIVTALVLYLCGVPDEDIIADYMVSSVYNSNGVNKKLSSLVQDLVGRIPDRAFLESNLSSDPKTMRALLDSFKERNIRKALTDNGFGEDRQQKLKMLMTENPSCNG